MTELLSKQLSKENVPFEKTELAVNKELVNPKEPSKS